MNRKCVTWPPPSRLLKMSAFALTKPASTYFWKFANLKMPDALTIGDENFKDAFIAHERRQRIYTGKVACLLVIVLMPAGACLDYIVYPDKFGLFLTLRLACSVLTCGLFYLHTTQLGQKHYRLLGVPIALLPACSIMWMMLVTRGEA